MAHSNFRSTLAHFRVSAPILLRIRRCQCCSRTRVAGISHVTAPVETCKKLVSRSVGAVRRCFGCFLFLVSFSRWAGSSSSSSSFRAVLAGLARLGWSGMGIPRFLGPRLRAPSSGMLHVFVFLS